MFTDWSPTCVTAPAMTSSTWARSHAGAGDQLAQAVGQQIGRVARRAVPPLGLPLPTRCPDGADDDARHDLRILTFSLLDNSSLSTALYTQIYHLGLVYEQPSFGRIYMHSAAGPAGRSGRVVGDR